VCSGMHKLTYVGIVSSDCYWALAAWNGTSFKVLEAYYSTKEPRKCEDGHTYGRISWCFVGVSCLLHFYYRCISSLA